MRRRVQTNNDQEEQITFDTLLEMQGGATEEELLNDIDQLLIKQERAKKDGERTRTKKHAKKAEPKHVNYSDNAVPTLEQDDKAVSDHGNIHPDAEKEIAETAVNAVSVTEDAHCGQAEKSQQEDATQQIQPSDQEEQLDAHEQEKALRAQRVAMFTKPDILLETPYTVTVGKKQVTRYRIEFGRPDATIPPEISSSTSNYISKIDEADELLIKKKKRTIRRKNTMRQVGGWLISMVSAVIIAMLLYSFVFVLVKVDGNSMLDTLHGDNYLFVWRLGYIVGSPQRGDVVICHYPDGNGNYDQVNYVKRVVGLPGETISIQSGNVYVDGRLVDEPYLNPLRRGTHDMEPVVLGADEYFVMGDNRINSADSRQVGPIKKDQIIGKALQKLLPLNEFSSIK